MSSAWKRVKVNGSALRKAGQDLGARPPADAALVLECQGSSVGTYTAQWTQEFVCSARGESAEERLDEVRGVQQLEARGAEVEERVGQRVPQEGVAFNKEELGAGVVADEVDAASVQGRVPEVEGWHLVLCSRTWLPWYSILFWR